MSIINKKALPAICVEAITKCYGATVANDDLTFNIDVGSIHAILGENGAGKSTIMKILSGIVRPDSGELKIHGNPVKLGSPSDAHRQGIQTAFQELTLIPDLTVLENMMLPKGPIRYTGILNRRVVRQSLCQHFGKLQLNVDINALVSDLNLATRQKIEIARAIYREPSILLLDEPTSALAEDDVEWLGEIILEAKRKGITVVFISHRLPEVRQFCDRVTILRNGCHVLSGDIDDFSNDDIIQNIIGRSLDNAFPPREPYVAEKGSQVIIEACSLSAGKKLKSVDLQLHEGEVLGIAGRQGMGQADLFSVLSGDLQPRKGKILVDGEPLVMGSPADALHKSIRIGFVPEERKTEGLFLKLSGTQNAALPALDEISRWGIIDSYKERRLVSGAFKAVEVDARAFTMPVGEFSGGNQQKIAIAKWLMAKSRVLLLFDPTRGIDVGTKHQLYELILSYASQGGSVLLHSTEIPELVHLCDRVAVFYEGGICRWLQGGGITETNVMEAALGGELAIFPSSAKEQAI